MNCPKCGKEVKADMASCPSCGEAIVTAPAVEKPRKKVTMTPGKIAVVVVGLALVLYVLIQVILLPMLNPQVPLFMGRYESDVLAMEFTGSRVTITLKETGASPLYDYTYSEEEGLSIAKGKFDVSYDPAEDTITVSSGTLYRVY